MQVCVDIGNSNAVIGLYDGGWKSIWRVSTRSESAHGFKLEIAEQWMETGYKTSAVEHVWISSVVPRLTEGYQVFLESLTAAPTLVIGSHHYGPIGLQLEHPEEIGTDLVANAFGAIRTYHKDCLIVDFGTALTFLAVTSVGRILGASIVPGVETALNTLKQSTAQLPVVDLAVPPQVAGRNTEEAIQSGIVYGYEGLVRHLLKEYAAWHTGPIFTIGTGGVINALPAYHKLFDIVHPALTLDGIRMIGEQLSARGKD